MRQVTVFHSQTSESQSFEVDNNVTTWGQLKDYIDADLSNKKVVIKETSVTLDLDEAELPEGDLTLFIFVAQSKAGSRDALALYRGRDGVRKIRNMAGNNLRRAIRRLNKAGAIAVNEDLSTEDQRKAFIEAVSGSSEPARRTVSSLESSSTPTVRTTAKKTRKVSSGGSVDVNINVSDKEAIEKLDAIASKLDHAVEQLVGLPDLIAEKLAETAAVVEVAADLKAEADAMKRKLQGYN